VACFGISGVEPRSPATRESVVYSEWLAGNMKPLGDRDWKMELTLGGFDVNDNFSFPDTTAPCCHCFVCMSVVTIVCDLCSLARHSSHTKS
jgi:hypothetical protein